jgi:hypothetical protein
MHIPIVEYGIKQTFIAHGTLCHEHRILHRDVSKNNVLLWHDSNANHNHRRGLLIDYDYAEKLDANGDFSLGTRTVSFITSCTSVVN